MAGRAVLLICVASCGDAQLTGRKLERALGAERGGEAFVNLGDFRWWPLRTDGRRERVELGTNRARARPREPFGDVSRAGEEIDGFLILLPGDHPATGIYALAVLFDGDADDAGEPLGRVLLRVQRAGAERGEGQKGQRLVENRSQSHPE